MEIVWKGKDVLRITVKTSNLRMPNAEVSKQFTKVLAKIPILQQNVRANLANFIPDLFWRVSFSDEDFKIVEDLGGHCRSSRFELECSGSRYCSECGM